MPYRDPARVQVTFCAPHGAVDDAAKAQPLPFRHRRVPASSLQSSDGRFDFAQGRSRIALQGILILNIFNMLTPDLVMTLADSERSQQSEDCSCRNHFGNRDGVVVPPPTQNASSPLDFWLQAFSPEVILRAAKVGAQRRGVPSRAAQLPRSALIWRQWAPQITGKPRLCGLWWLAMSTAGTT